MNRLDRWCTTPTRRPRSGRRPRPGGDYARPANHGRPGGHADRHKPSDSGQSTVELALVLPVVAILLLAIGQVGLVARDQVLLWHAAREGARAAAVDPTPAAARRAALASTPGLRPARLSVTLGGGTASGDVVIATVTYRSATTVPLVGAMVGDVGMTASVSMRVE